MQTDRLALIWYSGGYAGKVRSLCCQALVPVISVVRNISGILNEVFRVLDFQLNHTVCSKKRKTKRQIGRTPGSDSYCDVMVFLSACSLMRVQAGKFYSVHASIPSGEHRHE